MKRIYAILDEKNIVEDVIEADSDVSDNILNYFFPNKKIILETKETGEARTTMLFLNNKFIIQKPYDSWILDKDSWSAPVEHPNDGNFYTWNEAIRQWEMISLELIK